MYADDLSIFLEYKKHSAYENKANVRCILQTMEMFRGWSGLKINLSKTYLTVFDKLADKPRFVEELRIKWCTEFKLLGIYFDSTLSKMHVNYENAIESVRREINSWKFRFLTIYGKVTVIKTMCIPKLNHIAVVVPNPSRAHLRSLESELKQFITRNNPNIDDEKTKRMTVK